MPGQRKIVEIGGKSIGLFTVPCTLTAVQNVGLDELGPVGLGHVGGTTLRSMPGEYRWRRHGEILACPWHGREFDLRTGLALADRQRQLRRYPVEVGGDTIDVVDGTLCRQVLPTPLAAAPALYRTSVVRPG